jgi:hypothetical protein
MFKTFFSLVVIIFLFYPQFLQDSAADFSLPKISIPIVEKEVLVPVVPEIKVIPATSTPSTSTPLISDESVFLLVPFSSQAPLGEWSDDRQQDGCEEAGAMMAIAWAQGDIDLSPAAATKEIIALSDWQEEKYGEYRDVRIEDVASRIFQAYYDYDKVEVVTLETTQDLVKALQAGKIILAPTNGQALKNPHFTAPGPERHLLVITGYDADTDEFITNDPGTRYGYNFRYPASRLFAAIRVYESGYHLPITETDKIVLFIEK